MELQDYLRILRKRWVSITTIVLLALVGAGLVTLLMTPKYTATAQTFVSVRGATDTSDLLQGSNFSQNQVKSYAQLVTSPLVLAPVITHLGLDTTPVDLAKEVSADSPLDTVLINITATSTSAEQAAAIANATAATFTAVVPTLEQVNGEDSSPVKVTTVQEATPPLSPSSPKKMLNLALGLLVGLALGVGYAVLRETLDTKIHGLPDVAEVTDAPVLGAIPYDSDTPAHPLAAIGSGRGESLRRLRTNLQFTTLDDRPRTVVVTSAVPGEGKTTTTINLGLALAEANARVIVVDADLRRPTVGEYLGLESSVGLTTVLIGRARLSEVVQAYPGSGLHVLPAGQIPPNPSEVLGSVAMADLLDQLAASYDVVLLDTPPLLPVTDAAVLAKLCGGTLVVAGSGRLKRAQLYDALLSLQTVDAHLLGIVLNRVPTKGGHAYSYYYGDYRPREGTRAGSGSAARVVQPPSSLDSLLDGPTGPAGGPGSPSPALRRAGATPVVELGRDHTAGHGPGAAAAPPPGFMSSPPASSTPVSSAPGSSTPGSVHVLPPGTPLIDPARPAWTGTVPSGSSYASSRLTDAATSGASPAPVNGHGTNGHSPTRAESAVVPVNGHDVGGNDVGGHGVNGHGSPAGSFGRPDVVAGVSAPASAPVTTTVERDITVVDDSPAPSDQVSVVDDDETPLFGMTRGWAGDSGTIADVRDPRDGRSARHRRF